MRGGHPGTVIRDVGLLFGGGAVAGLTDEELLTRFLAQRDSIAFEAIVSRHGSRVLAVCRSILGDGSTTDDAFQATFLILVRKAPSIRVDGSLGRWLYGVSRRVAIRAAKQRAIQRGREVAIDSDLAIEDGSAAAVVRDRELANLLQEEIARLPSAYREPILAHYFEGLSHEESAARLCWPIGTVKGRLARARKLLRDRLGRRGVGLSAGAVASTLATQSLASAVRPKLKELTLRAVLQFAEKSAGTVPVAATTLATGVLNAMTWTKWTAFASAFVMTSVLAGAGMRFASAQTQAQNGSQGSTAVKPGGVAGSPALTQEDLDRIEESLKAESKRLDMETLANQSQASRLKSDQDRIERKKQEVLAESARIASERGRLEQRVKEFQDLRKKGEGLRSSGAAVAVKQPAKDDPNRLYPVVYAVGDLVLSKDGAQGSVDFEPLITLIKSSVVPGTWKSANVRGDTPDVAAANVPSITPFYLNVSLIVRHNTAAHRQIVERLRQLRRLRGMQEPQEVFKTNQDLWGFFVDARDRIFANRAIDYIISPGDSIVIEHQPADSRVNASGQFPLTANGTIVFPGIGEVFILELGLKEAREKISAHILNNTPAPFVEFVSGEKAERAADPSAKSLGKIKIWVRSANRFAHVRGDVVKPGRVEVVHGLHIGDAIKTAGGVQPGVPLDEFEAKRYQVDIEGRINDVSPVNLSEILEKNLDIVAVNPGDIIDIRIKKKTSEAAPKPSEPKAVVAVPHDAKASEGSSDDSYIIGAADHLIVEVPKAPADHPINGDLLVRPDGTINLGFYGDIDVNGLSVREAQDKIAIHLRKYLDDETLGFASSPPALSSHVVVKVAAYNSKVFYVLGDVNKPGRYPLTAQTTVLDALQKVGGLNMNADVDSIRLCRLDSRGRTFTHIYPINLNAIMTAGDVTTNYELIPGDRLLIMRKNADKASPSRIHGGLGP